MHRNACCETAKKINVAWQTVFGLISRTHKERLLTQSEQPLLVRDGREVNEHRVFSSNGIRPSRFDVI
jgi:hypothetical protein